ncbi:MAG: polysaccharide biosynthesis protein [Frankia sp.]
MRKVNRYTRVVGSAAIARWVSGLQLRQRVGLLMALDGVALLFGLVTALIARYGFDLSGHGGATFWAVGAVAVALLWFIGTALHLYLGRYRFGSFEEVRVLFVAATLTTLGVSLLDFGLGHGRPVGTGVIVIGGVVAVIALFGIRYAWRLAHESISRPDPVTAEPLIVFGAGDGGARIVASMQRTPRSPYYPVAILDDDPATWNLQVGGVRVRGGRDAVGTVARTTRAATLLIAVPSAGAMLLRDITALAEAASLSVKVLPAVGDLVDGRVGVGDIRDIDLPDLLGRRQIETDVGAVAGYLTARRVLVTGAGGSIGSELSRQIHRYRPAELIMLDRDESALLETKLSISGRSRDDDTTIPVLGDVRDVDLVRALFAERRPQVVFHAAALKHLMFLEEAPGEAVKTNVWGTLSVLEAAAATGVERFVNISTDKAANPISVLGFSKRITERLTAAVAASADGSFTSVRFGNVLGSRGSMLTVFTTQIAAGGPVTVTHPDITRYFMTVQEAVQLVVQAGAIGAAGNVLVLDMGDPVRIDDVARRLVSGAGRRTEIVYTGMSAGEKLHEDLFGRGEADVRPDHPLISRVPAPPLDIEVMAALDPWAGGGEQVRAMLRHYGRCDDLPATQPHRSASSGAVLPVQPGSPREGLTAGTDRRERLR